MAPLGAQAADLVVWWEEGYYARGGRGGQGDHRRLRAEDRQAGRARPSIRKTELADELVAALEAGQPPDFAFGVQHSTTTSTNGPTRVGSSISRTPSATSRTCSIRMRSSASTLLNATTGRRGLYAAADGPRDPPRPRLEEPARTGGLHARGHPKEWEAFWSFWCDQVQPAVRQALGRDDIWGIGLPMSVDVGRHGERVLAVRGRLRGRLRDPRRPAGHRRSGGPAQAHQGARQLHGDLSQGLHPARFGRRGTAIDNNKAFLAQNDRDDAELDALDPERAQGRAARGLLRERRDDRLAATAPTASRSPIETFVNRAAVFKDGGHVATAKEFVRFLVGEGWLAHYLDFAGERLLPPMPKLLDAPFWLDPSDPHRMRSAMQLLTRPRSYD